ncbi:MAG: O antigen biosynthesis rhamnosyltransferase RfbN [Thermodesulfovibrionales bacterium]
MISIIIPTLNAGMCIGKLLSMLLKQETRPEEIIIIDSSSEDNTIEIAKHSGAKTMIIPRDTFDHGRTRNLAALEARGDTLVFMTQDALPFDSTLLSNLTAPLQGSDIAAAYGRHIPKPDASPPEAFARQFNYPESSMVKGIGDVHRYGIKTFFFSNVCSAIRKDLFLKVGMFPEGIMANEDMLIAAKLILNGLKVAYVPEAMVVHSHNYSLLGQFRRYYNIGSSLRANRWVLRYAQAEGEGLRFIKEEMSFLFRRHRYPWIPYILLEAIAKYAGYRVGLIAG